jgi:hypothetical protein
MGTACCVLFVLAAAGCGVADLGAAKDSDPPPGPAAEFMISHWSFPKDPAQLKQFVADGFNTVIAVPEELPLCRQNGLKAILATDAGTAKKFVGDPIVWGYFILDEPARKKIPYDSVVPKVAEIHRLDTVKPAYVNLNELDDPAEFIRVAKPRILSYDYYQWWAGRDPFFALLEEFRMASLNAGIPLICWAEAVSVPGGRIPEDNLARIRLSVNCLLAYGAKGIQWWAWKPFNRDAGIVNAGLRHLGPVMAGLRSTDVFHTQPVPEGSQAIPRDHWVRSSTGDLLLGIFKDAADVNHVYVVNRSHDKPAEAALEFAGTGSTVRVFDTASGRWTEAPTAERGGRIVVRHRLDGGGSALLRIERGRAR